MAQAQIRCKCKICSKEFWHKHNCANRSEAERYEEWEAEEYIESFGTPEDYERCFPKEKEA